MTNNHPDPLTTSPEPSVMRKERTFDKEKVGLQAESIITTAAFPMVFKTALELGVIDTLADVDEGVWLSASEIALRLPTKPTNPEAPVLLDRMLIFLASQSIVKYRMVEAGENGQTGERQYAAEPVCMYFLNRGDGSGSLASLFMLGLTETYLKPWAHLKDLILKGDDAFISAHGMKLFEYVCSNIKVAMLFNRGMSDVATLTMKRVLEVYRGFEDVNTLVDVGGGSGTNMGLVTSKYPHIKGINFDLPLVLSFAPRYPGVEHVSGDMFKEIPKGDAIFLKWILHDWADEDCVKILRNCGKSLLENGKVIIMDMIIPVKPNTNETSSNVEFAMDMSMLTHCSGGKERSFSQIERLAFDSGFSRCEIICNAYSFFIIELHK